MPRVFDLDDVVALLESGTNIVTTRGELFGAGHRLGDEARAACRRRVRAGRLVDLRDGKQPRVHQRGASVRAALVAAPRGVASRSTSSPTCRGATRRTCSSSRWDSGSRSTRTTRTAPRTCVGEFSPSLALLAEAAGRPVDEWTRHGRGRGGAARRRRSSAGELPAGSVAAQRTTIVGTSDGVGGRAVHGQLVLHHRCRAGVGPATDGLAGARARRRTVRRRPPVSRAARGSRVVHARRTPRTGP